MVEENIANAKYLRDKLILDILVQIKLVILFILMSVFLRPSVAIAKKYQLMLNW